MTDVRSGAGTGHAVRWRRRFDLARRLRRFPRPLLVPLAFNAWTLRHLLVMVSWPNDVPFHQAMVSWATGQFQQGRVPLDGWFPRLSAGLPQFHHYQSLPHVLTGLLGVGIGAEQAFALLTYLLLAGWPIAVYVCARSFGLSRRASLVAAGVAPLVRSPTGYGFETFSYVWTGNGLWTQLWGMWGLPLGLAWSAQAVRSGRGFGRAVATNALTVACHLPMAWFGLLSLGLWPLAQPSQWRRRVPRTIVLGALSLTASAWLLLPFLSDQWASNASSFNGADHFSDSFGWRRVLGWVAAGDLIDAGRVPLLSVVALIGVATSLGSWRRSTRPWARELVLTLVAGLVLFIGRDPFAPLIDLVPGASEVFLHRYHAVVQLMLLLMVGIGVEATCRVLRDRLPVGWPALARATLAGAAIVLLALPGIGQTVRFTDEDRAWVEQQEVADRGIGADFAELVAIAEQRGDGRLYAGRINDWGREFRIGSVPAPILLAQYPVDSIGFNLRISSLSADIETYQDDGNAAELVQMGIRYLILPRTQPAPSGAFFLTNRGDLQLWELPAASLLSVVNLVGPVVEADRAELAALLLPALRASEANPANAVAVDFDGRTAPTVAPAAAEPEAVAPGRVLAADEDLEDGSVTATVLIDRPGTLVLRANWHPRWQVTVDGEVVDAQMAAPTWLAAPVPAGEHEVAFRYQPYPWTWPLVVAAVAAVVLGWWLSRRSAGEEAGPDGALVGPDATNPDLDVSDVLGDDDGDSTLVARRSKRWGESGRRRARLLAVCGAASLVAGCGSPHDLPAAPALTGPTVGSLSPEVRAVVLRSPTLAIELEDALAPDRATVLVLIPPGCEGCAPAASTLRNEAFGEDPFSVLVVGVPLPAPAVAEAARIEGLSLYGLKEADLATISEAHPVDPTAGVALVVRPDGRLLAQFDSLEDVASIVAAARS